MLMMSLNGVSKPCEVHIRGNYTDAARRWFEPLIPPVWREHVFIHETVSNDELLSRIAEHDIGLALELTDVPSRNLTVTNKLFQYLQAGLAVIATDTAGQREVFARIPDVGVLMDNISPDALTQAINFLLSDQERLTRSRRAALVAAEKIFCWEKEEKKVVELMDQSLRISKEL